MNSHTLSVSRTARYYTLGPTGPETAAVWLVAHGYGQLAEYFLRHFRVLDSGHRLVVAPEGLSRFYLEGYTGRVGATWMTRQHRLDEIADYTAYLSQLYGNLREQIGREVPLTVLGFSQGGATVCRWLTAAGIRCHRLILWAAAFPEDLPFNLTRQALHDTEVVLVYGTADPLVTPDRVEAQRKLLERQSIRVRVETFAGQHELNPDLLLRLS